MAKKNINLQLNKNEYLSDKYDEIIKFIDENDRVLIDANPGIGKTSLFIELSRQIQLGKRKGRLVFCAPYLIIQSQFNKALDKRGLKANFVLNASSSRKKLIPTDKIVISTYQSLKHIINDLNSEDLVVIDEAHTLAYSYAFGQERNYYDATVNLLYNTSAKLVFLSGTPNLEITNLLDLSTINVSKEDNPSSIISIYHSNSSTVNISEGFAISAIEEFGDNHLNIIYRKNTNECELIKERLTDLGYKAKIITSYHKKQEHYKDLVKYSQVNKDIQFLICTNVISTGTNVENNNIGKALMIGEYNPDEIKQFSKRFRDKLDIEVDVVLNPNKKSYLKVTGDLSTDINEVQQGIYDLSKEIENLKSSKIPEEYKNSYESTMDGTKSDIISKLITRATQQISYLKDLKAEQFKDLKQLNDALNGYNDTTSSLKTQQYTGSTKLVKTDAVYLKEIQDIREDFIKDYDNYSANIILGEDIDYYLRDKFLFSAGKSTNQALLPKQKDISDQLSNPYFENKILEPASEMNYYVGDFKKSIFLTSLNTRQINKLKVSLSVNKFLNSNINIQINKTVDIVDIKILSITHLSKEHQLLINIIKEILLKCFETDHIVIDDLKAHLEKKFKIQLRNIDLDRFPFKHLIGSKNVISTEYLRAVIDGIVFTKSGTNKKKQTDGTSKRAVIFQNERPEDLGFKSDQYKDDYKEITKARELVLFKSSIMITRPKTRPKPIIIPNKALILSESIAEYYKL